MSGVVGHAELERTIRLSRLPSGARLTAISSPPSESDPVNTLSPNRRYHRSICRRHGQPRRSQGLAIPPTKQKRGADCHTSAVAEPIAQLGDAAVLT